MKEELISIIIIVYNTEKYIEECIESVINQTYKNLEIIIVNDGSKDNSEKIIKKYEKKDDRIKFINRKENKGTLYTRLEGYNNSTGDYVFFIDSDDFIKENTVEKMITAAKKEQSDVVRCNFVKLKNNKYYEQKKEISEYKKISKENFEPEFYDLLYKTIYLNTMCAQLVKKELYKDIAKVNLSSIYGEDIQSNIYLYKKIDSIVFLPDCLYVYRMNENSITNTIDLSRLEKKLNDSVECYYNIYNDIDTNNIKNKKYYKNVISEKMLFYMTIILIDYIKTSNYKNIKRIFDNLKQDKKIKILFEKYCFKNELNKNKLIEICEKLLYKDKIRSFYLFVKLAYLPIYEIKRKIK